MNVRWVALGAACVCIAGVAAVYYGRPFSGPNNKIDEQDLAGIFERIRQDVGNYEYQAARWRGDIAPKISDPAMPPPPFVVACPMSLANYDYDITKVELSLQALAARTATGDVGITIPMGSGSLGPDVSTSLAQTQTRTIVLDRIVPYSPAELENYRNGEDYANLTIGHQEFLVSHPTPAGQAAPLAVFPISDTLIGLRKSLLQAAGKLPCFDVAPGETVGNSIALEFEVDKALDPTLGFSFSIVTAKLEGKIQNKTDNRITITFVPHTNTVEKETVTPAGK